MFNFSIAHSDNFISCSICDNKIKDKEYYVDAWGNPFHIYIIKKPAHSASAVLESYLKKLQMEDIN